MDSPYKFAAKGCGSMLMVPIVLLGLAILWLLPYVLDWWYLYSVVRHATEGR